ncbi:MAG: ribbon-helix-helix protein, CopG family [Dehalococcoidia bacterium]|nr:ribbon-helix-helix protein, CopG family [Dehalococcoidia bacterium]
MVWKINVSLPEEVLEQLDLAARESHASRSALLVQAVEHFLAKKEEERKQENRRQATEQISRLADELDPWDGPADVLKWRDRH